jgi:aryl-alcohol dehydrogenase-like predicted oxidoreductase
MILIYGTANFKNGYGINRVKLSNRNINIILNFLIKKKIKFLDVASTYATRANNFDDYNNFKVFSKLKKIPRNISKNDYEKLKKFILSEVYKDLKNFKVNQLEGYYVHNISDVLKYKKKLYQIFNELKKKKIVKKIGLSFYNLGEEKKTFNYFKPDIIQVPFNIFSEDKNNYLLKKIKKKGIKIFARSIFLQGLILKPTEKIHKYFKGISKNLLTIDKIFGYNNTLKKIELTIKKIEKNKNFDGIIFSGDTTKEINFFLKTVNTKNKNNKISSVLNNISKVNIKELDPRKWPKKIT